MTAQQRHAPGFSIFSKNKAILLSICIFSLFILSITAIEHDSLLCEETGDCPEVSHTVIKLEKRDDALARRIAEEHGMVIRVSLQK